MSIFLKTEGGIELMREANLLAGKTLAEVGRHAKPSVTTPQLDKIAEKFIRDNGVIPTFKGYPSSYEPPFPGSICASVNNVVVYGVSSEDIVLRDGDIISVDCGALLNGFNGGSCYTFCVGEVNEDVKKLLRTAKESLYKGIEIAQTGHHVDDVDQVIQDYCQAQGYGIARELTGHGIGREIYEGPSVPSYSKRGSGILLKAGMCIVIGPTVTMDKREISLLPDRWSIVTRDHYPVVHFKYTITIRAGKVDILSSLKEVEHLEGQNF